MNNPTEPRQPVLAEPSLAERGARNAASAAVHAADRARAIVETNPAWLPTLRVDKETAQTWAAAAREASWHAIIASQTPANLADAEAAADRAFRALNALRGLYGMKEESR